VSRLDEPATLPQRGTLVGEFARLGVPRTQCGRTRRLADSAALLGLAELGSTSELSIGEAGWLIRTLRGCQRPADLRALIPAPVRPPASTVSTAAVRPASMTTAARRVPRWQRDLIMIIFRRIMLDEMARREAAGRLA
jgi:hypothetical protein